MHFAVLKAQEAFLEKFHSNEDTPENDREKIRSDIGGKLDRIRDAIAAETFLNSLDDEALAALPYMFSFWAMPHQVPPTGDWRTWIILGGRGAGKTRAGAEWVRNGVNRRAIRDLIRGVKRGHFV